MSISNIFGIAGSAMNAQMVRMNSTASNMANAGTVSSSAEEAFKAKRPVFQALLLFGRKIFVLGLFAPVRGSINAFVDTKRHQTTNDNSLVNILI